MRGIGRWRKLWRRPLPVELAVLARPRQVVEVEAELPSSITRVLWVGVPSSSIASVPHSPGKRAVVVGGDDRAGHLLAEPAGVDRRALLNRVRLEAVAGRLVEEDAAEAVADHDGHAARPAPAGRRASSARAGQPRRRPPRGRRRRARSRRGRRATPRPVSTRSSRRATTCTPSRTRVRSSPLSRPSELAICTWRRASL